MNFFRHFLNIANNYNDLAKSVEKLKRLSLHSIANTLISAMIESLSLFFLALKYAFLRTWRYFSSSAMSERRSWDNWTLLQQCVDKIQNWRLKYCIVKTVHKSYDYRSVMSSCFERKHEHFVYFWTIVTRCFTCVRVLWGERLKIWRSEAVKTKNAFLHSWEGQWRDLFFFTLLIVVAFSCLSLKDNLKVRPMKSLRYCAYRWKQRPITTTSM